MKVKSKTFVLSVLKIHPFCQYCGQRVYRHPPQHNLLATRDHFIPKSKGGTNTWQNSILSCYGCNQKKADKSRAQPEVRNWHPFIVEHIITYKHLKFIKLMQEAREKIRANPTDFVRIPVRVRVRRKSRRIIRIRWRVVGFWKGKRRFVSAIVGIAKADRIVKVYNQVYNQLYRTQLLLPYIMTEKASGKEDISHETTGIFVESCGGSQGNSVCSLAPAVNP